MMRAKDKRKISKEDIQALAERERLEDVTPEELIELIRQEGELFKYAPDEMYQIDPRDGAVVLYNSARAKRPHDNPLETAAESKDEGCPVCKGKTTGIIDVAELSEGYTFINKNLYPILFPSNRNTSSPLKSAPGMYKAEAALPWGVHLLQWTSSFHCHDWYNMPLGDRRIVLERLAALEKKLLSPSDTAPKERYVSVIKNCGSPVGGSLTHGHQQVSLSNVMPGSLRLDLEYVKERGEFFSDTMMRENPEALTLKDYGCAILMVPWFMKRPYNMIFVLKDTRKQHLYELGPEEIDAVAEGFRDATAAIMDIMPRIGKLTAYNVTIHNGPGSGFYMEFLPYTQETGGFEHLGLWVCQGNPSTAAGTLREKITYTNLL